MADSTPLACSLGPGQLRERLAEIEAIGAGSLVGKTHDGGRHVLRFRAGGETERRLEAIVAAESRCCSFLDLALDRTDGELTLTLAAPAGGEPVADGLAAAFSRDAR